MKISHHRPVAPRGYLMLLTLVFGAIFITVLGALASYALTQNRVQIATEGSAKALSLAEAGLEYYRWFLAHNPGNTTNGTGQPGPYVISYNDPEGGLAGTASLSIVGNQSCGTTNSIQITSTGVPSDGTNARRSIYARYAQPTVANYSFLLNDSVWAGADRIINGPYHSNGGIRMDGTANSGVSSSQTTWLCTSGFGCSPSTTEDGVFGAGPNQTLWRNSVSSVDFVGFATDFSALKTIATASGRYLPRVSTGSGAPADSGSVNAYWNGYHLIFNANSTVTINRVTSTVNVAIAASSRSNATDPNNDRTVINGETFFQTYTLPASCGLIFVEDNVWVEGIIPRKVTVVAANVNPALPSVTPSAMLPNNITYTGTSSGLTLIAQNNVLIAGNSPQIMTLNGIFIAQAGAFGRNFFGCPSSYDPRTSLTINGSTVSFKRTGTRWQGGGAANCSGGTGGYATRVDGIDRVLASDPPIFTPTLTDDYQFVEWREI